MESINSFFTGFNDKNIFATYPSEYSQKQKPVSAFCSKDLFVGNKTDDVNKEIAMYLDILYKDEYLVKGRAMTTGSDLIGRVKDDELITGSLFLVNKYGHSVEPTQETFSTDYYLVWVE